MANLLKPAEGLKGTDVLASTNGVDLSGTTDVIGKTGTDANDVLDNAPLLTIPEELDAAFKQLGVNASALAYQTQLQCKGSQGEKHSGAKITLPPQLLALLPAAMAAMNGCSSNTPTCTYMDCNDAKPVAPRTTEFDQVRTGESTQTAVVIEQHAESAAHTAGQYAIGTGLILAPWITLAAVTGLVHGESEKLYEAIAIMAEGLAALWAAYQFTDNGSYWIVPSLLTVATGAGCFTDRKKAILIAAQLIMAFYFVAMWANK